MHQFFFPSGLRAISTPRSFIDTYFIGSRFQVRQNLQFWQTFRKAEQAKAKDSGRTGWDPHCSSEDQLNVRHPTMLATRWKSLERHSRPRLRRLLIHARSPNPSPCAALNGIHSDASDLKAWKHYRSSLQTTGPTNLITSQVTRH